MNILPAALPVARPWDSTWQLWTHAIPAFNAKETPQNTDSGATGSLGGVERALFDRIAREQGPEAAQTKGEVRFKQPNGPPRAFPFGGEATWRRVWLLYAAGILLSIALGISAYRVGIRHSTSAAKVVAPQPDLQKESALEEQLSDAGHERELAQAEIRQRDPHHRRSTGRIGTSDSGAEADNSSTGAP